MKTKNVCFVLLSICACTTASAEKLYKWKDAAGTTHYSQNPPESKQHYETIHPKIEEPAKTPPPTASSSPQTNPTSSDECQKAMRNLSVLNSDAPITMTDKQQTPLTQEERSKQIALAQAAIQVHCKPQDSM